MAVPCAIFLGRFIADTVGVSILSMVYDCCSERDLNGSCSISHRCSPGCYRLWSEDGSSTCVKCKNETSLGSEVIPNVTECRNSPEPAVKTGLYVSLLCEVSGGLSRPASQSGMAAWKCNMKLFGSSTLDISLNSSSTPYVPHNLGSPGIAASLLLGILFISLFLILSVASFFYLKRSQKLPEIFYRRNKASIFQPSEMASMIPNPKSSVRKPRGTVESCILAEMRMLFSLLC
uniref:Chromosome 1 open reading frame 159 n=1 Tax=Xenopus tropicalis TaxID=8364 RepID=A0A803KFI8_XENTR